MSERWLQDYVNQKYYLTTQKAKITQKKEESTLTGASSVSKMQSPSALHDKVMAALDSPQWSSEVGIDQALVHLIGVTAQASNKVSVNIQLHPQQRYLPENLQLMLLAESGDMLQLVVTTDLPAHESIRVIIETENEFLRRSPWHLWRFFDDYPQAEIALSPRE